jgi:hypothetical protein
MQQMKAAQNNMPQCKVLKANNGQDKMPQCSDHVLKFDGRQRLWTTVAGCKARTGALDLKKLSREIYRLHCSSQPIQDDVCVAADHLIS